MPFCSSKANPSNSLLKNPRHSERIVIQFFYHESAGAGMRGAFVDQGSYLWKSRCRLLRNQLCHRRRPASRRTAPRPLPSPSSNPWSSANKVAHDCRGHKPENAEISADCLDTPVTNSDIAPPCVGCGNACCVADHEIKTVSHQWHSKPSKHTPQIRLKRSLIAVSAQRSGLGTPIIMPILA